MRLPFLFSLFLTLTPLGAQSATLIRDADLERGLRELAQPVLAGAGLSTGNVRILIVDDPSLNAFVIDRHHIFIHSGLILKLENAEQLQAVIAHEAAHITNGHVTRRIANLQNRNRAISWGMVLAAAVAAAGEVQAAGGIAAGAAGSAQGVFLSHTRAEEASADQSSIAYLRGADVPLRGMLEVLDIFRGQEVLNISRQDPYARSHPLTRDRIRALEAHVAANPDGETSQNAAYWFARVRGKLSAFERAPSWTLRHARGNGDVDQMRRAVALHRSGKSQEALDILNQVINRRSRDPYLQELKGQILLESRQFNAAVQAYKRAVDLAPNDALILGGYGRALLAAGQPKQALRVLIKARTRDARDARILRDLGTAYAQTGQNAMAVLTAAERYALIGDRENAKALAKRALGQLAQGSVAWKRAQALAEL